MGRYRIVLVDSDVVRHFIVAGKLDDLPEILAPNKLFIIDNVYTELSSDEDRKTIIDNWITNKHISRMSFPYYEENVRKEYYRLKKHNGLKDDGERACMAMARFRGEIIASSNFSDIKEYCTEHSIDYIGCIDILYIAWENGIFSEQECNKFIDDAKRVNNARFPINMIADYIPDRDLSAYLH